jgi:hypothetical protein
LAADQRECGDVRDFVGVAFDDVGDEVVEQLAARAQEGACLGGRVNGAAPAVDTRDRVDDVRRGGEAGVDELVAEVGQPVGVGAVTMTSQASSAVLMRASRRVRRRVGP